MEQNVCKLGIENRGIPDIIGKIIIVLQISVWIKGDFFMSDIQLPHHHHDTPELPLSRIPDPGQFQTAAEVLKLLGDANRIRIFWILCHCEECVLNLSAMVDMSSPAVSHHLKLLKEADLVTTRRAGKEMYYTAARNPQADLLHHTIERMIAVACPSAEA